MLDVRWALTTANTPAGREDYDAGHVPGAFFVDLDTELAAPPGRRRAAPAARAGRRRALAASRAASPSTAASSPTTVGSRMPPRGPGGCCAGPASADVRVLDGGYAAWVAAGLPVSTEEPADRHGDVEVRPGAAADPRRGRCGGARARRAAPRRPGARALRRRDRADRPGGRPRPGCGQQPDVRLDHGGRDLPPRPRRALGRGRAGHDVGTARSASTAGRA